MFRRSIQLPQIGSLKRGWGKWYGYLPLKQLSSPLELWIKTERKEPVEPFVEQAALFVRTFAELKDNFSGELFESYKLYRQAGLKSESFTEADIAKHPVVHSRDDVWKALRPFRLCLGLPMDRYLGNSYLLIDVDWPNPHYFQLFLKVSPTSIDYMHVEIVG